MARYKPIDTGMKLLPVDLSCQLLPGTFEHALSHLLDHELDLRVLDERFRNDENGAPAYAPVILLKVILYAYSRGMIRSRDIAQACQENVTFMVLSGDSIPHFTTIAAFVRELKNGVSLGVLPFAFSTTFLLRLPGWVHSPHQRTPLTPISRLSGRRTRRVSGRATIARKRRDWTRRNMSAGS